MRKTYLGTLAGSWRRCGSRSVPPLHRSDWGLENVLLLAGVAVLVVTYRISRCRGSRTRPCSCSSACTRSARTTPTPRCPTTSGRSADSASRSTRRSAGSATTSTGSSTSLRPAAGLPDARDLPAHRRRARLLGLLPAARPHDVDVDAVRAHRVGRGRGLRRRPRAGLPGHAGRRVGRAQGHGARVPRRADRDGGDRGINVAFNATSRASGPRASAYADTSHSARLPSARCSTRKDPHEASIVCRTDAVRHRRLRRPGRRKEDRLGRLLAAW